MIKLSFDFSGYHFCVTGDDFDAMTRYDYDSCEGYGYGYGYALYI